MSDERRVEEDAAAEPAEAPDTSAADEARVEADLDQLLDETKRERDEYLDLARRTKADFENYRRRATNEAREAERRGKAALAQAARAGAGQPRARPACGRR